MHEKQQHKAKGTQAKTKTDINKNLTNSSLKLYFTGFFCRFTKNIKMIASLQTENTEQPLKSTNKQQNTNRIYDQIVEL